MMPAARLRLGAKSSRLRMLCLPIHWMWRVCFDLGAALVCLRLAVAKRAQAGGQP